jgi:hypothetical protein
MSERDENKLGSNICDIQHRIEEIYAHVVHTMPIIVAKNVGKKNFFSLMAIRGRFEILFVLL